MLNRLKIHFISKSKLRLDISSVSSPLNLTWLKGYVLRSPRECTLRCWKSFLQCGDCKFARGIDERHDYVVVAEASVDGEGVDDEG